MEVLGRDVTSGVGQIVEFMGQAHKVKQSKGKKEHKIFIMSKIIKPNLDKRIKQKQSKAEE